MLTLRHQAGEWRITDEPVLLEVRDAERRLFAEDVEMPAPIFARPKALIGLRRESEPKVLISAYGRCVGIASM
jgi:hypothetical protein